MKDEERTKEQLISEVSELRRRMAELEILGTARREAEEALKGSEEAARRLAQETEIIAAIGRIIGSTLNIEEVYERFAQEARRLIQFDRISVNFINHQQNTLSVLYVWGTAVVGRQAGEVIPFTGTGTEEVSKTRTSLLIQTDDEDEIALRFSAYFPNFQAGIRSALFVPLIARDRVIGSLSFLSKESNAYTDRDRKLAENIGYQIAGAIANAHLFNDRLRAEEALRKSEEFYKAITENSSDIIFILNKKGIIIYASPSIERFLGYRPEELIGRSSLSLILPTEHPRAIKDFGRAVQTEEIVVPNTFHVRHRDSSERVLEGVGKNLFDLSAVAGFVMNIRDVTERKRADEEREKLMHDLQKALTEVKRLKGIFPICASCKKIRDDQGYWRQIEAYIRDHSEAEFSHSFCPECWGKLYGGFYKEDGNSKKE